MSTNEVVFSSGSYTTGSGSFQVWTTTANTTVRFRQTGGTILVGNDFDIGCNTAAPNTATGIVVIAGGTNKLTNTGKAWTVGRRALNAFAEVSGSGVIDCSISPLYIEPNWAGGSPHAEFRLKTGGTFIGTVSISGSSAGAKFFFDGGLYRATAATPFSGQDHVYVEAGGAFIDTESRDVTIAKKLQGVGTASGGLVKFGTGSLTLSGVNTYAGRTIVSNGTLSVANASSLPNYDQSGYVTVCSGATLTLGAGWTTAQKAALRAAITVEEGGSFGDPTTFDTSSADITDSASYTNPDGGAKTGAYGLTLTGANDFGGLFTVKGGSLAAAFGQGLGVGDHLRLAGGLFAGWDGLVTNALGTTAGTFDIVSGTASGFSALTGATTVRVGDSVTNVLSFADARFQPGTLILNDTRAKGTLTVENPLELAAGERVLAVQSTAHPSVLAGGVRHTEEGALSKTNGVLKSASADGATLVLGGTNVFKQLYHNTGWCSFGSGSTNDLAEIRVENGDLLFDGSTSVIGKLCSGRLWSSGARTILVTNDAAVAFGEVEFNAGTVHQSSGCVEAETLRFGPYYFVPSVTPTLRYYLTGGTLRGKRFYLGEAANVYARNGYSELIQTGGVVEGGYWSTDFTIGWSAGYTARYYLRGGRFNMPWMANDGKIKAVEIAHSGKGFLEVSGTGVLSAPWVYLCGWNNDNATAVGELQLLTGGTVVTHYIGSYGSGCKGTVTLNGGTLRLVTSNSLAVVSTQFGKLQTLQVGVMGFTFDSDASVTSAQPFTAVTNEAAAAYDRAAWRTVPAFTKTGAGTFTLVGTNTYPCATAVEAGTLRLAANALLPTGSVVRVAAGATLDCSAAAQEVKLLAGTGDVKGNVTVTDAFSADATSLDAGTGLTVTGTVTFGPDAVIDVRSVDEATFRATRKLVTAGTAFDAVPSLRINGAPAGAVWTVMKRSGGRELALARIRGTVVLIR